MIFWWNLHAFLFLSFDNIHVFDDLLTTWFCFLMKLVIILMKFACFSQIFKKIHVLFMIFWNSWIFEYFFFFDEMSSLEKVKNGNFFCLSNRWYRAKYHFGTKYVLAEVYGKRYFCTNKCKMYSTWNLVLVCSTSVPLNDHFDFKTNLELFTDSNFRREE